MNISEILKRWHDETTIIAGEDKYEEETVDVSKEGIMVTHIEGGKLDKPELLAKIHHKKNGLVDLETEEGLTFTNAYMIDYDLGTGTADASEFDTNVPLKFSMSFKYEG